MKFMRFAMVATMVAVGMSFGNSASAVKPAEDGTSFKVYLPYSVETGGYWTLIYQVCADEGAQALSNWTLEVDPECVPCCAIVGGAVGSTLEEAQDAPLSWLECGKSGSTGAEGIKWDDLEGPEDGECAYFKVVLDLSKLPGGMVLGPVEWTTKSGVRTGIDYGETCAPVCPDAEIVCTKSTDD